MIGEQLSDALHLMELTVLVRDWLQGFFQSRQSIRNNPVHLDPLSFEVGYPREVILYTFLSINEAEMEKKFAEEMKKIVADKNTPKITKNVSFKLKKVDNKWLIDTEATDMDEVLAAFMPGMM